jgi:hypothetical protein
LEDEVSDELFLLRTELESFERFTEESRDLEDLESFSSVEERDLLDSLIDDGRSFPAVFFDLLLTERELPVLERPLLP